MGAAMMKHCNSYKKEGYKRARCKGIVQGRIRRLWRSVRARCSDRTRKELTKCTKARDRYRTWYKENHKRCASLCPKAEISKESMEKTGKDLLTGFAAHY